MHLPGAKRTIRDIQSILHELEMYFAHLGVRLREPGERAIVGGHARAVGRQLYVEAALIHVVVERIELA